MDRINDVDLEGLSLTEFTVAQLLERHPALVRGDSRNRVKGPRRLEVVKDERVQLREELEAMSKPQLVDLVISYFEILKVRR